MQDINQKTLSKALRKLPDYSPDNTSWEQIEQRLNDLPLKNALKSLPVYEAPAFNFEEKKTAVIIEQEFPQKFWYSKLPKVSWKLAAAVLLFAVSYYFIADKFLTPSPDVEQEIVEIYELPESTTDKEFSEIMQLCEAEAWVCEKPGFQDLKADYKELENAQAELTTAMQIYGQDLSLIKQFNDIERQKALILNDLSLFI